MRPNRVSISWLSRKVIGILILSFLLGCELDQSPPTQPTNLTVTNTTHDTISVKWDSSTDNIETLGYNIFRGGNLVDSTSSTEYTDSGLSAETEYRYYVVAYDAAGNESTPSNEIIGSTTPKPIASDTTAPEAPGNLIADEVTHNSLSLSWNASTDNVGIDGYHVLRDGSTIDTTSNTTYTDDGLTAETEYHYTVIAYDTSGNESLPSEIVVQTAAITPDPSDTTAPSTPQNLMSIDITDSTISLSWDASTDNIGVTGYHVLRNGAPIDTTSSTNYTDNGLSAETEYRYSVTAFDAANNTSSESNEILASTTASADIPDTTPPTIPTNLENTNLTESSVTLSWSISNDDTATTGYRIFRNGREISTSQQPTYTDQGLTSNTQYQYQISAYDAAGNESDLSSTLNITTQASVAGSCGTQTGSVIAIPFNYVTPVNTGKYLTLSATSTLVEYNNHSYTDAPNINWSKRYKNYKYGNGGGAVTEWRVDTPPNSGTLYEGTTALSQNDTIADPDNLIYVPNTGFIGNDSFTYCASDATGSSNVAKVTLQIADPQDYPMPIGVPDPGFGIDESAPADPASWPESEQAGYYYIDSDHPACSDDGDYGYPDLPRCTIPSNASIDPGAKMVLATSTLPYSLRDSSWHQIEFNGQANATSWLVGDETGPAKPHITPHPNRVSDGAQLRITGGHLRISGVVLDKVTPRHMGGGMDNVVLRHSEVKNIPSTGRGGTSVNLSTGGENVLAFNVYAHDNGIVEADGLSEERDIHAFVGSNQTGFWMLDNRCDENAGDCVQLGNNNTSSDVFIGRLVAHSEGENCIDIKDFNRVVVSESHCWDLRPVEYGNSGGNAQNFYVNDEGIQQNYVYFLNNRSWDTGGSNYAASNVGGRVYFIGNISFASPAARGLNFGNGGGSRYAYFNTFSDSEIGIMHYGSGASLDRFIAANIIDGATQYQLRLQADTSVINTLDYNFYTDTEGDFASGGSSPSVYQGLSAFKSALSFSANSLDAVDAGFESSHVYDFRLRTDSELINRVLGDFISAQPLYTDLTNDLGIELRDIAGITRPQGRDNEPGAYVYAP